MFNSRLAPAALLALAACASLPARPDSLCGTAARCTTATGADMRFQDASDRAAFDAARRLTRAHPDSANAWLDLARAATRVGDAGTRLDAYRHFVSLDPNEPRGHELLGWALLAGNDAAAALPEMRAAVRLAPERPAANAGVGYALTALQRHEEALRAFTAATRLDPADAESWGQMAVLSLALGREGDALADWDHALHAQPGYFDGRAVERQAWEATVAKSRGSSGVAVVQAGAPATEVSGGAAAGTPVSETATPFRLTRGDEPTSSGSGFVVSSAGLVLTNKHVIRGCSSLKVRNDSTSAETAHVVAIDANDDLALLSTKLGGQAVAVFRDGAPVRRGEDVVAVGYPLSGLLADQVNVSPGAVNALAGMYNDPHQLQMSAPVQPGSSGGPLLDASGNVVGIVVTKLNAKVVADAMGDIPQNVNFALKGTVAESFLASNGVQVSRAPSNAPKSNADVGDIGRRVTVLVECWR